MMPAVLDLETVAAAGMAPSREAACRDRWKALFRDIAAGSDRALAELYDSAAGRIFGLALWRTASAEDARDVVQDTFLAVAELRARKPGLAGLPDVADPLSWLLTVAHRKAVDVTRRRRRREAVATAPAFLEAADPGDSARRIDAERASRLMARLTPAQREAIYLRLYAGCTFAEIGRITRVPMFTAASRYRLGIAALRRLLEGGR